MAEYSDLACETDQSQPARWGLPNHYLPRQNDVTRIRLYKHLSELQNGTLDKMEESKDTLRQSGKERMEGLMEHVARNHMLPMQCQGKSYFLSTDRRYVLAMVKDTTERPDAILPHKNRRDREVRKKKFEMPVGVHGITKVPCYRVTVILNRGGNEVISAFPTV